LHQESYHKLISGQSSGPAAVVSRFLLGVAAQVYSAIIRLRNFAYAKGWLKTYRANAVVISVGNITAGGTGKTPLVIRLCKFLQQRQFRCAVLTRGYKTHTQTRATRTDEPAILAKSCPDASVIINPNRVEAAKDATDKFGAKVLIMDDGFQHRRLQRDLDIVTIDATCPFGYGKLLPAGLLREPVTALSRADAAVITRCDQASEAVLTRLEGKLKSINPDMLIARSLHAPVCAKSQDGTEISVEQLKDKNIFAFCGLGNPNAFLNTIKTLGANLAASKIYNDHHHYTDNNIADIHEQAERSKADLILTTQKDWTKIISDSKFSTPLVYLVIELKFLTGEDKITRLIENTLAGKIPQK